MNQLTEQRIALDGTQHQPLDDLSMELPFKIKETYELIDFFHQAPNSPLLDNKSKIRILRQLLFFCDAFIETFQDIRTGLLENFDPHVGDTSCQFRAYLVCYIFKKNTGWQRENTILINTLQSIKKNIYSIIEKLQYTQKTSKLLFKEFFEQNFPKLHIDRNLFFLFISRFLTVYNFKNEEGMILKSDCNLLMTALKETQNIVVRLISHYQQMTSNLTCFFIIQLAQELRFKNDKVLALTKLIHLDSKNRTTFSCYYGMQIIIQHALKNKLYIGLSVSTNKPFSKIPHKFEIFCSPNAMQDNFKIITKNQLNKKTPIYIIRLSSLASGATTTEIMQNFTHSLQSIGIKDTLLTYMARHPQHAGIQLATLRYHSLTKKLNFNHPLYDWQKQFLEHRQSADQIGCSAGNPTFFFAKHCLANTLEHLELNTLSPISMNYPSIVKNLCIWPNIFDPKAKEISKNTELIHWLDRSSKKLTIVIGSGLEQNLWGYIDTNMASQISKLFHTAQQEWQKQHSSYLENLPIKYEIINFTTYLNHPDFLKKKKLLENYCNSIPTCKAALNETMMISYTYWQSLTITPSLSKLPAAVWRRYIINLTTVNLLWHLENQLPALPFNNTLLTKVLEHLNSYTTSISETNIGKILPIAA